jgi:hypothetical protein
VTAPDEPTDSPAPSDDPAAATAAPDLRPRDAVPDERAVPDEQDLERVAVPATVRRAPKFGAFITTGGLVGALLGLVFALVISSPGAGAGHGFISFLSGDGTVRLLATLAFAVLGGFVGGALAVGADRRSTARR